MAYFSQVKVTHTGFPVSSKQTGPNTSSFGVVLAVVARVRETAAAVSLAI